MHSLVRFGQAGSSLRSTNARVGLIPFSHAFNPVSPLDSSLDAFLPRKYTAFPGCVDLKGNFNVSDDVASVVSSGPMSRFLGNFRIGMGLMNGKGNIAPSPYTVSYRSFINPAASQNDVPAGNSARSMDFVRGILEENKDMAGGRFGGVEQDADFVHIKIIRNNTFVTVTDSKGNKKIGASSGCLAEMKGGPKVSRYASEATAEHVGRMARNLGLKSVVMKVNGFTYFKKKKQAILSWREGYTYSRGDLNPIVHVEDTTRRAHNGCRLCKKRRV